MTFNLAKFLLNSTNEFNGHKNTTISGISVEDGIDICRQLEWECNEEYSFACEVYVDGCFSIYQKDYWQQGEHPLGHIDRLILGVEQ